MSSTHEIRTTFLDYFQDKGHTKVQSSPLVPDNDPTLMFTNAGMVQFKNVFTGAESRNFTRATSTQKCVRAGGKHNDLDNVGYTARHHTFFEMLGNFSFGDYFKEEAIFYAWDLITKGFGISPEKLTATVYAEDDEAFDLWKKIAGLPDSRILRIPTADNFWSMGDTGPCGPCSEIFYDHGDHIPGGPPGSPDEDGDRFVEIWNLVFMQYDQLADGRRVDLPKPSIDTGMGLERVAALMQGTHNNYETDIFKTLIEQSAHLSHTDVDGKHITSHRVIADHIRSTCFLMADGVLPSNEGRGYVLRRIMRRAMRHAHMMGCDEPLMHRLVPALVSLMGETFPELNRAQALMTETLKLEETRFKQMLSRGLKLLEAETEHLPENGTLDGEVAFKLYDTYGFPLDLTQDALRAQNYKVDTAGFNTAMERQRAEARAAWAGSGDAATEAVWFDLHEKLGATEFLGYTSERANGEVVALIVNGEPVDKAPQGTEVMVLTNQTPFYAESGGQVGDTGVIKTGHGGHITVADTLKKLGDLHVHKGKVETGSVAVGDSAELIVDHERRASIRGHHSVTHLLHKALRMTLGDHVTQKGSLVAPDRLRFDVSNPRQIAAEDIKTVERIVNAQIQANRKVETRVMDAKTAVEEGAMALFGEKYGDEVRVVSMGATSADEKPFSTELCGGTHVNRTGDIGFFKVVSEGAVAAGVRRIEAMVGQAALSYVEERDELLVSAAEKLKISPADICDRITALQDDRRKLERELAETRKKLASGGAAAEGPKDVKGVNYVGRILEDVPPKDLRGMADAIKKQIKSGVVAVLTTTGGKASLVVGVTDDVKDKVSAVDLVRAGSAAVGGKGGGGRPDMAQAGGPDGSKAQGAIDAIETKMAELL